MSGTELRQLRSIAGLTQEQAARALDVTQRTVWRWEHNINRIDELKAKAIREILLAVIFAPGRTQSVRNGRWPHIKAAFVWTTCLASTLYEASANVCYLL